ncbi:glutamine amidotransferase [Maritimibacter sp. DP1N21-5]|uniref:glutamine amidotransferase n=1 Tax=Maritimibacter sp. DP1N21-5 TaxID=2836867 RepID=UPI001C481920|nr:glutamine amidotransferase [Maritimibacter sp. DP1N21-5]MBV7409691.1 glutamine amidotransferase [Maritimibacter sp. DP1N21-5]
MKPFLILQLRPERVASDDEFAAILTKGGLDRGEVRRIELDHEDLPLGLDPADFAGIIVGGGPGCVSDPPEAKDPVEARIEAQILSLMPKITDRDLPFLGCCYGIGILGQHLAPGSVSKDHYGEAVGPSTCRVTVEGRADPLLTGLPDAFDAFVGHKEALDRLPAGVVRLVTSGPCPNQMVRFARNVYATQFHPELDAQGLETRIGVYRHRGYFPPETAEALVAMGHAADVTWPGEILRNFVRRFRG